MTGSIMRTFARSKIHGATLAAARLEYEGSIRVYAELEEEEVEEHRPVVPRVGVGGRPARPCPRSSDPGG